MDRKQNNDDRNGLVKRKRNTIQILYEIGKPTLRVAKVTGKHLAYMGIPTRDGFQLFPEEAVFLVENGSAVIITEEGRSLNILECYGILEKYSFPMFKYEIYKSVKQTGLVILRPRKSTMDYANRERTERAVKLQSGVSTSAITSISSKSHCTEEKNLEIERMEYENQNDSELPGVPFPDFFPTMRTVNGRTILHVQMPPNQSANPISDSASFSHSRLMKCLQGVKPPTRNARRNKSCRNPSWPENFAKHAKNWEEFRFLREEMSQILKNRKERRKYRFKPPTQTNRGWQNAEDVDYHVFSPASFSHRLPAKPVFNIVCSRSEGPSLNLAYLSKIENAILAVEEAGKINFISISGLPIDLNSYLESV